MLYVGSSSSHGFVRDRNLMPKILYSYRHICKPLGKTISYAENICGEPKRERKREREMDIGLYESGNLRTVPKRYPNRPRRYSFFLPKKEKKCRGGGYRRFNSRQEKLKAKGDGIKLRIFFVHIYCENGKLLFFLSSWNLRCLE